MTAGTYERTEEIRARNRANASPGPGPCADDCLCRRHRSQAGRAGHPCLPDCNCARHNRTAQHNSRIGMGVALTSEAKRNGR